MALPLLSRVPAFLVLFIAALMLTVLTSAPARSNDATDRLGIPGPIGFDGRDYALAWSSNPSPGYFKQEYVPDGQAVERYQSMILVEVAAGVNMNAALAAQTNMLNRRKGSDPLVNLDVIRNDRSGEIILDFIVSDKDEKGEYIAEWNAYRYASLPGGRGTVLFAISHRAYGNDGVRSFLGTLKSLRPNQINKVAQFKLPVVAPAR